MILFRQVSNFFNWFIVRSILYVISNSRAIYDTVLTCHFFTYTLGLNLSAMSSDIGLNLKALWFLSLFILSQTIIIGFLISGGWLFTRIGLFIVTKGPAIFCFTKSTCLMSFIAGQIFFRLIPKYQISANY